MMDDLLFELDLIRRWLGRQLEDCYDNLLLAQALVIYILTKGDEKG